MRVGTQPVKFAMRLVPGGGLEPPRAEARRILSYLHSANKALTRFATNSLRIATSCYRAFTCT